MTIQIPIVAMGDSTTAGTPFFESPLEAPPDGRGEPRGAYGYWLMQAHPEWTVLNRGVNGERSDQIAARFDRDVIAAKPAAVVIIAGVNDVYQGRAASAVTAMLRGMYDRAARANLPVVAGSIVPYNSATPAQNASMHEINVWIARQATADLRLQYVDTRKAAAKDGQIDLLAGSPDGLHPDIDGYHRMADAIAIALERLLPEAMTFCRVLAFGFSVMLASVPAAAQSSAVPEANPGRPTVSAPATLTPLGYVQIEAGVASATMSLSFSSQFGAGATAKLTVHPRVELFTQAEPFVRSRVDGDPSIAPGGIVAGAQVVLLPGTATRPTVSIAYQRTTYGGTAPDGDTGSSRQSALALVSGDVRGFHVDANGIVSDALVAGRRVAQYGEAIAVSHAIGRAAIAGEFWRFSQPFLAGHPHTAGTLWALSYALRPNLVVDGGVSRGGSATSTRWQVMTGVTYVVPSRFW